jgi:cystathionine beta-lyase/cystathionine gamma-synthase
LAPFDCFLLLRGIKTLPLRLERAQANAMKIAEFLSKHESVTKVFYAGLLTHADRDIHIAQASGAGSVMDNAHVNIPHTKIEI